MMGQGYMMGNGASEPLLIGTFIDSAVEGLGYETPTHTGMTDANGSFMYHEGDTIRFYVGDIMLGEAMAKPIMTPIDLVDGATDETNQAVVNMTRVLQTMDDDMNPENGISITNAMFDVMSGHMIDFNVDPDQFAYDPDVMSMMDAMNQAGTSGFMRMMVSPETAIAHFSSSMNNMATMMTEGTLMIDSGINDQMMPSGGGMM